MRTSDGPSGVVDVSSDASPEQCAQRKHDGCKHGEDGDGHVGGSSQWKERCALPDPKVDRPGNLSTVVVDKILTKSKNCGAKAAVFPNITSRAEGVTCSFPPLLLQMPARSDRWRRWAVGSTALPALHRHLPGLPMPAPGGPRVVRLPPWPPRAASPSSALACSRTGCPGEGCRPAATAATPSVQVGCARRRRRSTGSPPPAFLAGARTSGSSLEGAHQLAGGLRRCGARQVRNGAQDLR